MRLIVLFPIFLLSLLLLLLSSSSPRGHFFSFYAFAKKEVKGAPPIKEAIPKIRCSLCEHVMYYVVRNTLDYIQESGTKNKLREERLIDHVIEPLCVPYTPGGAWLRGADWDIVNGTAGSGSSDSGEKKNRLLRFRVRERGEESNNVRTASAPGEDLKNDYVCGPRCATAAAACEDLIMRHSDNADKITGTLVRSFKSLLESLAPLQNDESAQEGDDEAEKDSGPILIAKQLVNKVCKASKRWRRCRTKKDESKPLAPAILKAAPLVPMSSKEVEVEEMMYRMKNGLKGKPSGKETDADDEDKNRRSGGGAGEGGGGGAGNPGVDVYSRDEMMQMREALRSGDREKLMELDPQATDLSDDEFDHLTEMHRQEFGPMKEGGKSSGEGGGSSSSKPKKKKKKRGNKNKKN